MKALEAAAVRRTEWPSVPSARRQNGPETPIGTSDGGKVAELGQTPPRSYRVPSDEETARARSRAASWRAHLVRTGRIVPLEARPTLRMDDRARRAAERHMKAGDYGRVTLGGPDYFSLPFWHQRALDARERRTAQFNAFLKRVWPPRMMSELAAR